MPQARKRQLMKEKVRLSNRKQVITGVTCFILFSAVLLNTDAFELFYDFSREHEDWELDEIILVLFSALVTSSLTFAYSTWHYNRTLKEEIDYRVKLEMELAHAQKLQSLGTLAGGIAHSTNNYLQPIQTLSRLSKKQLPEESPLQSVLDKILQASEHAQEVLDQLLRFSHQGNRENPVCDLQQELSQHQLLYQSAVSHAEQLTFKLTDQSCPVALSNSQCADILLALITNAEDSYDGVGGPIEVQLEQQQNMVQLSISDQGCGMDNTLQQRIFEPFYTSKTVGQGTGLGLSIVHGLIQQPGGSIEVKSEPGKGSRFIVHLPLANQDNLKLPLNDSNTHSA